MTRLALVLTMLLALAACAGAPSNSSNEAPRESRPANEPANPERVARARLELAGLYFGQGQFTTALEETRVALQSKPDLPDAYSLRGLIYAAMGDARQAEESFQRALQLVPTDGNAMHNYAWFLCQQRRFPDADAMFARTLAQPSYRESSRTLLAQGVCQARGDRWGEAERTLARAFELDPANPTVAFNLSEVLLRRGELERARFYVRRVNSVPEQVTSQSLWLAARIERRMGNFDVLQEIGRQLRDRFPQAPETAQFERGRFDD
jgi:type IV pilus assembly protein PilF